MGKDKYLVEQLLSENLGSKLYMRLDTILEPDGRVWKIVGACDYALTMDGKHWGEGKVEKVMTYDTNVGNGIATVMYSIMNTVGDSAFLTQLSKDIEKAELAGEQGEGEAE